MLFEIIEVEILDSQLGEHHKFSPRQYLEKSVLVHDTSSYLSGVLVNSACNEAQKSKQSFPGFATMS